MAFLNLCTHRLAQLTSSSATSASAAHLIFATLSIAALLMLCYAVWNISHQVLLHRLAQPISCSATPSSAAHFKLCPHGLAQLTSMLCYTVYRSSALSYTVTALKHTPSSAAHFKLCPLAKLTSSSGYTSSVCPQAVSRSSAAHLKLCYTRLSRTAHALLRLGQLTSCFCYTLAQLISTPGTRSCAAHLMLLHRLAKLTLKLCPHRLAHHLKLSYIS